MMTRLYNRQVQVLIDEGKGGRLIELSPELNVRFDVRKDRSESPNQVDIEVLNLGQSSKAALSKANTQVALRAGYAPEGGVLAVGQIVRVGTSWEGADSVTKLQLGDGILPLSATNVSLSFPVGASAGDVLEVLAGQMGLPYRVGAGVKLGNSFATGYSYVGKVARAIGEVARRANARWSIQNGVLQLVAPNDKSTSVYELTPSTGLLARVEELESTVVSGRVINGRLPAKGYVLTCLLLPMISPNDWVRVESRDIRGDFVVDEVYHNGGNRDDSMTTRLTVYER